MLYKLFRITGIDHSGVTAGEIFNEAQAGNLSVPYGYSYSGQSQTLKAET